MWNTFFENYNELTNLKEDCTHTFKKKTWQGLYVTVAEKTMDIFCFFSTKTFFEIIINSNFVCWMVHRTSKENYRRRCPYLASEKLIQEKSGNSVDKYGSASQFAVILSIIYISVYQRYGMKLLDKSFRPIYHMWISFKVDKKNVKNSKNIDFSVFV